MKTRWWIILVVIILAIVIFFAQKKETNNLITPSVSSHPNKITEQLPSPTPNIPKTYQLDSSTDLKMELESINPQVLESDFE